MDFLDYLVWNVCTITPALVFHDAFFSIIASWSTVLLLSAFSSALTGRESLKVSPIVRLDLFIDSEETWALCHWLHRVWRSLSSHELGLFPENREDGFTESKQHG